MVVFFRLGLKNAWRNLARSTLAILSMALAAAFLTNAISFSRGYSGLYRGQYRAVLGGEISVYNRAFDGEIPSGLSEWSFQRMLQSPFTDALTFYPELASGYLSDAETQAVFDASLLASLQSMRGVSAVYPRYQMPADTLGVGEIRSTPLRGRDIGLDAERLALVGEDTLLFEGRLLEDDDEGEMVAVVSRYQHRAEDADVPKCGDIIHVQVPRMVRIGDNIAFDYTQPVDVYLETVGVVSLFTRNIVSSLETPGGEVLEVNAPLHWQLDDIHIPLQTWKNIWEQAADFPFVPEQIMLQLEDLTYMEDLLTEYRTEHPELTFAGISELVNRAETMLLIENVDILPEATLNMLRRQRGETVQEAMQMDLRVPLSAMIFMNAALVIAANLLIMVNERKTEIGILKAVGSMQRHIMVMALAEALLISCCGAVLGFAAVRFPATLNQLSNHTPLLVTLRSIATDLLNILGASVAAALLFGMIPALNMARLSVNEVLRSE